MKMKIPSSIKNLLENKYVLYIVFFLAVTNLFGYMVMGNYKAIAMFVLVGYLVYVLNKNMIVVLLVPLILTSLFTSGFIREGNTSMARAKATADRAAADQATATAAASAAAAAAAPDDKALADKAAADKTAAEAAETVAVDSKKVADDADATAAAVDGGSTGGSTATSENTETKSPLPIKVNASGEAVTTTTTPTDPTVPAPNGSEKAAFSNPYDKRGSRLDYAATVEDAYGDLNKILGGDGIKNLTADTQKLMTQQLQLADAMKSMTPLLEQAKSLIGGFDMKNFGNITEMAKQFKASGSD
jgi:hypothetical protein